MLQNSNTIRLYGTKNPKPKQDLDQGELICFVGAAYGNQPAKRRSTTGFYFTVSWGKFVSRYKNQSINALSSTESDIISAVTSAKTDIFLRSTIWGLGFPQESPTQIYEDNYTTINTVNSSIPTERTCHIDVWLFAIQGWKKSGDIIMYHIPGIINPDDDLTKPLGWVLHYRHARYLMGHYNISFR